MSQSALSEQAGASKAAISQYLSGKNTPALTVSRPLPMQPAFPLIT
ncbi:MAG: helix-turn-helix domain-containing protein [Paraprevotella clara]